MQTIATRHASKRRLETQRGSQILEFVLVAMVFIPTLMMSFITGMNLIKTIEAKQAIRDIGSIYIRGGDFSNYHMQALAQRLSTGLGMNIGSTFTGSKNQNLQATGNVIVYVSQIMWVGDDTSPNCVAAGGAGNCTNKNSFVFNQRIEFGSSAEKSAHPSILGNYSGASTTITNTGAILGPVTNPDAKLSSSGQSAMNATWMSNLAGQVDLSDGQVVYVVEGWFNTAALGLGTIPSPGVYARFYF